MPLNYIYQISCKDDTIKDTYIGSTYNIRERKSHHKSICNNDNSPYYTFPVYKFIRNNGGWENWTMTILEQFECDTNMEKLKKERSFFEQFQPSLNTYKPANHQAGDQWDEVTYKKAYYIENIDHRKEYMLKQIPCPCCNCMINLAHSSRHYKTTRHMKNLVIKNKTRDTINEMYKMHDDNLLAWKEIYNTFNSINTIINKFA